MMFDFTSVLNSPTMHYMTTNFSRIYPKPLTEKEVYVLPWEDFITYTVEALWNRTAQKEYGKDFDDLEFGQKQNVEILALLEFCKALDNINKRNIEEKTSNV